MGFAETLGFIATLFFSVRQSNSKKKLQILREPVNLLQIPII